MEKNKANDCNGFTLLEVLIAMAIMLLAFTSILSTESSSIRASEKAIKLSMVAMLARNRLIESEQEIQGKSFDEVKKEEGDAFKSPYQDYRWTRVIKEVEFPNLSAAGQGGEEASGASGNSGGGASSGRSGDTSNNSDIADLVTKLITKFLSKSLREVTITVFWKRADKEQSFAVSTYWVDLNHDFELTP